MEKKLKKGSGPQPNKLIRGSTAPNFADSPLTFDLSNKYWLKSIYYQDFTNKLKDETMFAQYL